MRKRVLALLMALGVSLTFTGLVVVENARLQVEREQEMERVIQQINSTQEKMSEVEKSLQIIQNEVQVLQLS